MVDFIRDLKCGYECADVFSFPRSCEKCKKKIGSLANDLCHSVSTRVLTDWSASANVKNSEGTLFHPYRESCRGPAYTGVEMWLA